MRGDLSRMKPGKGKCCSFYLASIHLGIFDGNIAPLSVVLLNVKL